MKKHFLLFTLLLALMVPMAAIGQGSLPFNQNFNSGTTLPNGWSNFVQQGSGTSIIVNSRLALVCTAVPENNPRIAIFGVRIPSNNTGDNVMHLAFEYSGDQGVIIGYVQSNAFHTIQSYDVTNGITSKTLQVAFPTNARLAFITGATGVTGIDPDTQRPSSNFATIDNVSITSVRPTNLAASNIDDNSATITWNANNASKWEVQYKPSSASDWMNVSGTLITNTCLLSNLSAGTSYDVRVRTKANSGNYYTDWSSVYTFNTVACAAPTNLTVSNLTSNSATVNWESAGNWFHYQYRESGEEEWIEDGGYGGTGSTFASLTEVLEPNTTYEFRVQNICNLDPLEESSYATTQFTTETIPCSAPTGLTVSNITATGATFAWNAEAGEVFQYFMRELPYTYNEADFIHDGNGGVYYGPYTYAVSFNPDTDNVFYLRKKCGENVFSEPVSVTFHTIPTCPSPTGLHVAELTAHSVRIEWDAEEGAMFQPLMPGGQPTYPFDPNNPPTNWNVQPTSYNYAIWNTLSPETTYGVWLRKYCSESDQSEPIYIMFTTPEACPAPTGLTLSFTETGYRFSWDAESGYQFYYTDAPVGNTPVWSTSYTTDNYIDYLNHYLGYNEDWTFYLKKKCSENDFSEPVSITFRTKCATTTALGYSENFDDYTVPSAYNPSTRTLPDCWNAINTTTYELYSVYPSIYNFNNNAHSGSNCLTIYSSYSTINNHDPQPQYAILPLMDDLGGVQVTLWAKGDSNNTGVPSSFKIGTMSDPDDVSTFSLITEQPLSTSYEKYDFYIPTTTDKYIAFMIDAADSNRDINGVYIDDIVIPTCSKPRGLRTTELTAHSVRIEWFEEEGAMFQEDFNTGSFDPNTPPDNWNTQPDYNNYAYWYGLEPEHFYGIWVRKYCSETDQSEPIYITFTTPEACPAPTGLHVVENSITSTGASFTWDAEEGATFEYFTISDPWEGFEPAVDQSWTSTPNNTVGWPNAFSPNEVVRFYLRKDCGEDGYSDYTYVEFRTLCGPMSLINGYSEDFNNFTNVSTNEYDTPTGYPDVDLPHCWQFLNRSESAEGYPQAFLSSNSEYAVSGNCLFFKSSSTTPLYAILPEFVQNIAEYKLTFTYCNEGMGDYNGTLHVGYMTDPSDASTFVETMTCAQTRAKTTVTAYFPNAPQGSFMAFKYVGGLYDRYYLGIDDVVVTTDPSCFPTGTLDCVGLSSRTATLSWQLIDFQQNAWVVEYSKSNQFFNTVFTVDATQNWNFVIENLEPLTTYYARVRGNCGEGSLSDVSNTIIFTTLDACPVPTNLVASNLTQNTADLSWTGSEDVESYHVKWHRTAQVVGINEQFDEEYLAPDGWQVKTGLLSDVMNGAALSGESSPYWHFGTSNGVFDSHAYLEVWNTSCKSWLITPRHRVKQSDSFTFDLALTAYSGTVGSPATTGTDDRFVVLISIDGGQSWDILREWNNSDSDYVYDNIAHTATGEQVSIDLSGYVGIDVRIAFYGESTVSNANNNLHIDNVKIGTQYGAGGYYNYQFSQPFATLTDNLEPGMEYEVQVKSDCSDPEVWSEPITFKTLDAYTKVFVGGQAFGNFTAEQVGDQWSNPNNWVPNGMPGSFDGNPLQDVIIRHDVVISDALGNHIIANANSITFEGDPKPTLTLEDGNQLRLNINIDEQNQVTVKKNITGYTGAKDHYYLISVPAHKSGSLNASISGLVTTDSEFDLYDFDPTNELEWRNYKEESFSLYQGEGHLYANAADVELSFTGEIRNNKERYTIINNQYYSNADYSFNGWELCGNPFTCNAYLSTNSQTMAFYRMNAAGTGFEVATDAIKPMEGFFSQNTVNGESVILTRTAPGRGVRSLNLVLSQGHDTKDNAIIRFDEGNTLEKLSFREGSSKIYMPVEGKDYAVVNAGQMGELPFCFKAEQNGTYTLSFTNENVEFSNLHLIDNLTGEDVDLLALRPFERPQGPQAQGPAEYTFEAKTSDHPDRFVLVYATEGSNQNDFVATAATSGDLRENVVLPLLPFHSQTVSQDADMLAQAIPLVQGWNWWTPMVKFTAAQLNEALNGRLQTILSKAGEITLTSTADLEPGQMYRLNSNAIVNDVVLAGEPVSPTINIESGTTNWIGYTGETTTDIAAGLNTLGITPANGDKIISQDGGFAIYTETNGVGSWSGTLTTLEPGKGYVYVR